MGNFWTNLGLITLGAVIAILVLGLPDQSIDFTYVKDVTAQTNETFEFMFEETDLPLFLAGFMLISVVPVMFKFFKQILRG